jgi:hypothetical protein
MKKGIVGLVCATAILGATSMASASEGAELRRFEGFSTDAAVANGLWGELGTAYARESDFGPDIDFVTAFARLAYGADNWELGAQLPYAYADYPGGGTDDGLADMTMWGKILALRTDTAALGGGMELTFPTGHKGFTTDEYGFMPFVNGALTLGWASLRGSFGYDIYTGGGDRSDNLDYNLSVLLPAGDQFAFRAEIVGQHYLDSKADPVGLVTGFDVSLPCPSSDWELLVRPSGLVGFTDEAANWGLGISLAIQQAG